MYDILEGSFPHRLIETGQKFHGPDNSVRDEFSSPFHWETQSQAETFYVMEPTNNPGNLHLFILLILKLCAAQ